MVTSPKEIQMVFAAFAQCSSRKIIRIASRDLLGGAGRFLIFGGLILVWDEELNSGIVDLFSYVTCYFQLAS